MYGTAVPLESAEVLHLQIKVATLYYISDRQVTQLFVCVFYFATPLLIGIQHSMVPYLEGLPELHFTILRCCGDHHLLWRHLCGIVCKELSEKPF